MAALSDFLENKLLEHITGKASYAMPTVHVALFTVAPTDSAAGTEVTGGGYSRKATTGASWNAAANGQIKNAVDLEWATASASWGSVVAIALMDAPTGGNVLVYGTAQSAKTIESGDTYRISAGNLTLSLD